MNACLALSDMNNPILEYIFMNDLSMTTYAVSNNMTCTPPVSEFFLEIECKEHRDT